MAPALPEVTPHTLHLSWVRLMVIENSITGGEMTRSNISAGVIETQQTVKMCNYVGLVRWETLLDEILPNSFYIMG
ncbi:MAG: hypothetical protein DDT29_00307 [Dehalococcoidia bacterium]|nr:hypothetical protein [Bacillota bacterium]